MKKLLFIFLLLLISCGGSYQKPEASPDSLQFYMDTIFPEPAPALDSDTILLISKDFIAESVVDTNIQKDTVKPSTKKLVQTKLDTTSNLPMIRKNREIIDYQQKQLDSLIIQKKKK